MREFSNTNEYSGSFAFRLEPDVTEINFLVVYQVMDVEDLNAQDVYDLSVTVFKQDEAYRPMPVFYFFTRATREELTDQTTFPLKIMATLRESKEFRDVSRDCYLKTVQPLETWSPYAPYFFG